MKCEHPNKIYEDSWLHPLPKPFTLIKEYYCPDCKETFTIPKIEGK